MKTLILDFDNTLCDSGPIIAFGKEAGHSWKEIYKKTATTRPIAGAIEMIHELQNIHDMIISTARGKPGIPHIKAWLEKHNIYFISEIYFRGDPDLPSALVKKENLEKILATRKKEDLLVIEDNFSCLEMYNAHGIEHFASVAEFCCSCHASKRI